MTTRVKKIGRTFQNRNIALVFHFRSDMHNQHKMLRVFRLISMLRSRPARSLKSIASSLGISERSAYRYIDLLKDLGFHVQTDSYKRLYLDGDESTLVPFTSEEAGFLRELVLTVGKGNKLRDSLLEKLFAHSDQNAQGELIFRAHLSKMVEELTRAIREKRQVVLQKYMSANSNNIRDRKVEPVSFTNNYQRLVAFEPESMQNKTFNLERITRVRILKRGWQHEELHRYTQPDVFGFHENGKQFPVDIELSLRAALILREEFPMTAACLTPIPGTNKFRFATTVYDMRPVKRFLKGLEGE